MLPFITNTHALAAVISEMLVLRPVATVEHGPPNKVKARVRHAVFHAAAPFSRSAMASRARSEALTGNPRRLDSARASVFSRFFIPLGSRALISSFNFIVLPCGLNVPPMWPQTKSTVNDFSLDISQW